MLTGGSRGKLYMGYIIIKHCLILWQNWTSTGALQKNLNKITLVYKICGGQLPLPRLTWFTTVYVCQMWNIREIHKTYVFWMSTDDSSFDAFIDSTNSDIFFNPVPLYKLSILERFSANKNHQCIWILCFFWKEKITKF